jgi:protease-4
MRRLSVLLLFLLLASGALYASLAPAANTDKFIAVIRIQGPLYGAAADSVLGGRTSGSGEIMRQIVSARDDDSVTAVLFRLDTPGGSITSAEEISREIKKLKAAGKLTVSSMGDVAASAGYWLASETDYIFANSSTLTGSIGVYIPYTNIEELYKKIGISSERIKSGQHKDMLAAERPMSEEERRILQTIVDEMYDDFIKEVSAGRNISEERIRQLADGRVYTGKQAKELQLVDELGNYFDALDYTAKRAGQKGTPAVKTYDRQPSWQEFLRHSLLGELSGLFADIRERFGVRSLGNNAAPR